MSDSGFAATPPPLEYSQPTRPTSVTVVSWIILVSTLFGSCGAVRGLSDPRAAELMSRSPIPVEIQYGMLVAGFLVSFICACGWLNGFNWSRLLYVIWGGIGGVVGLATSPTPLLMIPGIIFFAVITLFLYLPAASDYFMGRPRARARG